MDNGTMQGGWWEYSLCMFLLFNKGIVKFHVPDVNVKTKIRNRGIPSWNN